MGALNKQQARDWQETQRQQQQDREAVLTLTAAFAHCRRRKCSTHFPSTHELRRLGLISVAEKVEEAYRLLEQAESDFSAASRPKENGDD